MLLKVQHIREKVMAIILSAILKALAQINFNKYGNSVPRSLLNINTIVGESLITLLLLLMVTPWPPYIFVLCHHATIATAAAVTLIFPCLSILIHLYHGSRHCHRHLEGRLNSKTTVS